MKENGNRTIEKDKGEEVIEVVRSSFSKKDLLNVNLIDSHRLKFSIPSSSQSIMGSQDLHISYDCDEDLLSYKLCLVL